MNCQEALNLLYDIIDKEASEVDTKQVEEHLEKCRDCFEKYRLETEIQNFLGEKLRKTNSEAAHNKLKAKILDQLDEIDTAGFSAKNRETRRPFRFPAIVMVAAASAVVMIGAGLFGMRLWEHRTRFIPLEQSHWTMAGDYRNTPFTSTEMVVAEARQRYGYELQPVVGEYRLAGGRTEELLQATMLHYVYVAGESTVSVFLAPAAVLEQSLEQSSEDRMHEVVHDNSHFFDHNCRGCRLVFHRIGQTMVITASSDRSVDLVRFVPGRMVI